MGTLGSKGLRVPSEKNRMAQIINEKVKTLCNSKGLKFVTFGLHTKTMGVTTIVMGCI